MTRRDPDGTQETLGNVGHEPNGLAMDSKGNLYNANIGDGKIYKMQKDGSHEVILEEIDGQPLGAVNFVFVDSQDRLWISVSTREPIWFIAAAAPRPDGYVILMDENGARIVGDGIYFPNEIRLDADEKYLVLAFFVSDSKPLAGRSHQEIFKPIISINKAIEFMSRRAERVTDLRAWTVRPIVVEQGSRTNG
jgi:sugar lactone lactonase YvrE